MAGLVYFLEGWQKPIVTIEEAAAAGLGHALAGSGPDCAMIGNGPGGKAGILLAFNPPGKTLSRPVYKAEAQAWRQAPGKSWWVGYERATPPGPAELARGKMYAGEDVKLRDGKLWHIPRAVAVLPDRPVGLPLVMDLDETGNLVARVAAEYAELCELAGKFWRVRYGLDAEGLTLGDGLSLAAKALAVNYRASLVELALLGLLGTDGALDVMLALIDAKELEGRAAAEKAKGPT